MTEFVAAGREPSGIFWNHGCGTDGFRRSANKLNGIVFSLVGIAPSSRWTLLVMQRVGAVVEFGKNEAPGGRSSC